MNADGRVVFQTDGDPIPALHDWLAGCILASDTGMYVGGILSSALEASRVQTWDCGPGVGAVSASLTFRAFRE